MTELPRVMVDIIKDQVLYAQDTWWLKSKYLRRGRLVEHVATMAALGRPLADSDPWWSLASGRASDPDDYLPHEECRPAVEGALRWLRDTGAILHVAGLEVVNPVERYRGHLDWVVLIPPDRPTTLPQYWLIDIKHGRPPAAGSALHTAYRLQTSLYAMALYQQEKIMAKRAGLHIFDGTYKFVHHELARDSTQATLAVRGYHFRSQFRGAA